MVGWSHADSIVTGQGKEALQYNGMIDAFRKTVRHEGMGALYKGLVPNSVKVWSMDVTNFDMIPWFACCLTTVASASYILSLFGHLQVVPSIAIAFVTYEAVKDVLGVEMRISD